MWLWLVFGRPMLWRKPKCSGDKASPPDRRKVAFRSCQLLTGLLQGTLAHFCCQQWQLAIAQTKEVEPRTHIAPSDLFTPIWASLHYSPQNDSLRRNLNLQSKRLCFNLRQAHVDPGAGVDAQQDDPRRLACCLLNTSMSACGGSLKSCCRVLGFGYTSTSNLFSIRMWPFVYSCLGTGVQLQRFILAGIPPQEKKTREWKCISRLHLPRLCAVCLSKAEETHRAG